MIDPSCPLQMLDSKEIGKRKGKREREGEEEGEREGGREGERRKGREREREREINFINPLGFGVVEIIAANCKSLSLTFLNFVCSFIVLFYLFIYY